MTQPMPLGREEARGPGVWLRKVARDRQQVLEKVEVSNRKPISVFKSIKRSSSA